MLRGLWACFLLFCMVCVCRRMFFPVDRVVALCVCIICVLGVAYLMCLLLFSCCCMFFCFVIHFLVIVKFAVFQMSSFNLLCITYRSIVVLFSNRCTFNVCFCFLLFKFCFACFVCLVVFDVCVCFYLNWFCFWCGFDLTFLCCVFCMVSVVVVFWFLDFHVLCVVFLV